MPCRATALDNRRPADWPASQRPPAAPSRGVLFALYDSMVVQDDRMASMYACLPAEQAAPLTRALLRVAAELLQRDARVWDELARSRTPEDRSADAFLLLMQRVTRTLRRLQDGRRGRDVSMPPAGTLKRIK